ncbi:MAG: type II toxin-antitoxin system VapC family toxin [Spirochaetaceae bacterium]|nr:type II toxin-antitoxin system VapC family toxin [Spirochaetaceae bacterium]
MKKSVYIETTIPSYATAKTSRDIVIAHRQALTKIFWENERQKYDLCISDYVIDECGRGDPEAAKRRLDLIAGIPLLPETERTVSLAHGYFDILDITERVMTDCFHLAVCVDSGIDYLLSWNYTHLGHRSYGKVYMYNYQRGLKTPDLLTPEMFMDLMQERNI